MKRRAFIAVLGGAAAWPVVGRAQQREQMRRIGVVILYPENDPQGQLRATDLFAKEEFRRLAHEFNAKADQLDFRPGTPDGLDGGTNRPSHTLGSGNVRSWRALRVLSARSNLLSGLKGNVGTMAGCKVQRPATERASRPAPQAGSQRTTEIFRVY